MSVRLYSHRLAFFFFFFKFTLQYLGDNKGHNESLHFVAPSGSISSVDHTMYNVQTDQCVITVYSMKPSNGVRTNLFPHLSLYLEISFHWYEGARQTIFMHKDAAHLYHPSHHWRGRAMTIGRPIPLCASVSKGEGGICVCFANSEAQLVSSWAG